MNDVVEACRVRLAYFVHEGKSVLYDSSMIRWKLKVFMRELIDYWVQLNDGRVDSVLDESLRTCADTESTAYNQPTEDEIEDERPDLHE